MARSSDDCGSDRTYAYTGESKRQAGIVGLESGLARRVRGSSRSGDVLRHQSGLLRQLVERPWTDRQPEGRWRWLPRGPPWPRRAEGAHLFGQRVLDYARAILNDARHQSSDFAALVTRQVDGR